MSVLLGFLLSLACFVLVGILSVRRAAPTSDDYLLAGRQVSPWLTALSAIATNNSGFMFIGLIGVTYSEGLTAVWIMGGWMAGDYAIWLWVARGLRIRSEEMHVASIPGFLSSRAGEGRGKLERLLVMVTALVIVVFLGAYAAAQLNAGSKALHVLFGWDYSVGALLGAALVVVYCFSGGIRASIWTDAAQSCVMIAAMLLLLVAALYELGGPLQLFDRLRALDPELLALTPRSAKFGLLAFLASWFFAGLGVAGQPHVMIRAMAIHSPEAIPAARRIYIIWYILFTSLCILVGLASRALLPAASFDQELALPLLAGQLLPGILVGVVLAGLFAATMSTADSQVLSCSAAISRDLFPDWSRSYMRTKLATLLVVSLVLPVALFAEQSVFRLVLIAWSALASALGPLLILRSLGARASAGLSLSMVVSGLAAVIAWQFTPYSGAVYGALPGMMTGFSVYALGWFVAGKRPLKS
ncbi:MAG: sodium/proline symporter [Spirochaetales bacterium]|nr:sodium/proline symporter [Spirochaetales bacterium]